MPRARKAAREWRSRSSRRQLSIRPSSFAPSMRLHSRLAKRHTSEMSKQSNGVDEVLALFPENLGGATVQLELVDVWESSQDIPS